MAQSVVTTLKEIRCAHGAALQGKSILSINDLSCPQISCILNAAFEFKKLAKNQVFLELLKGKLITTLFYEASTRTRCSFEAAMKRLGGDVLGINEVASSSVAKGETLQDTIRTVSAYSDAIVLRHSTSGASKEASLVSKVPIFNAGDGCGEHPTQALLDLFTIREHFPNILQQKLPNMPLQGKEKVVVVSLVGDLLHGRTVHSLAMLLARYNVQFNFVAPSELQMPDDIVVKLDSIFLENGWEPENRCQKFNALDEIIQSSDIIYMTRLQKERLFSSTCITNMSSYELTFDLLSKAPKTTRVMHPLPRVDEINKDVDSDPRAIYFDQAANGLYVRMALLWLVLCSDSFDICETFDIFV